MHFTAVESLSKEEIQQILSIQSSELNIKIIAQHSLDHGSRMGAIFVTPTDFVYAVGRITSVNEKSFFLQEENATLELRFEQVVKGYPIPDWCSARSQEVVSFPLPSMTEHPLAVDHAPLDATTDGVGESTSALSEPEGETALSKAASSLCARLERRKAVSAKQLSSWLGDSPLNTALDAWPPVAPESLPRELLDLPLDSLELSVRTYNVLRRSGHSTLEHVLSREEADFLKLRDFGRSSLIDLKIKVALALLRVIDLSLEEHRLRD